MADTLHLDLRGRTWWYIRKIPPALRPMMRLPHKGKAMFRHNLQTSDLAIAQRKRPALNAALEAEIAAAMKRAKGDANPDATARADDLWRWVQHGGHADDAEGRSSVAFDIALEDAEKMELTHGTEVAHQFYMRATGQKLGTDISGPLERWIGENPATPYTNYKRRKVIKRLAEWRSTLFLETLTHAVAGEFVEGVIAQGRKVATINGDLGILTTYWQWLMDRHILPDGPIHWRRFRRKKERKRPDARQRPFTDAEMKVLFLGEMKMRPDLLDIATVAAHTGGRLEEVGSILVRHVDFTKGTVHLPGFKTDAAPRTLPLHPALLPLFARRCADKDAQAWVFDELPVRKADDTKGRTSPISKAFTRFRRLVKVDEVLPDETRSLVDFHSFRRWFTNELRERNTPDPVVDMIMGWSSGGMRELYAPNPDFMEQMRVAVNAVDLPQEKTKV